MLRFSWVRASAMAVFLGSLSVPRATFAQAVQPGPTQASQTTHEIRYADQIDAFIERDRVSPPPQGAIFFYGASIFRLWTTLEEQMEPLPVFNRAFGGCRTWEALHYADQIVLPYRPSIIVYYCGANDVNQDESAEAIAGRFGQFVARVASALPETRVFFVSINRAPAKMGQLWNVVDAANALIRAYAVVAPNVEYIDVNPALFDSLSSPRMEMYTDGLHLTPAAYVEYTRIIRPVIAAAWERAH